MRSSFTFALAVSGMALSAIAQGEAGKSVVKITCRAAGGESVGTGFAWNQAKQIVTALHVVAGCTGLEVYSEGLQKGTSAKVKNVFVESDLALLELADPIGLIPVKTSDQAIPGKDHTIWGYPQHVKTMQGDDLKFSKVLKPTSTLEDVMTSVEYKAALGSVGYPSQKAAILRIGSTIQPGHSGAPIYNPEGNVVGIGDGGLYQGIKSINWAIPASNLPILSQSKDKIPTTRPKLEAQFSVEVGAAEQAPIELQDGGELRFAFSSSVKNIAATASPDEKEGIKELIEETAQDFKEEIAEENHAEVVTENQGEAQVEAVQSHHEVADAPDLGKEMLDVYEDPATGATIAVPKGMRPKFDPENHMITASDAEGRVTLYVQVQKSGGREALKKFENFLNKGEKWKQDPEISDDRVEEPGSLEIEKSRIAGDDPENPSKTLQYSASVDGDAFLGTAIVAMNFDQLSLEDKANVHLMEMCVGLAGFRID